MILAREARREHGDWTEFFSLNWNVLGARREQESIVAPDGSTRSCGVVGALCQRSPGNVVGRRRLRSAQAGNRSFGGNFFGLHAPQPLFDATAQAHDLSFRQAELGADFAGRESLQAELDDRAVDVLEPAHYLLDRLGKDHRFERSWLAVDRFAEAKCGIVPGRSLDLVGDAAAPREVKLGSIQALSHRDDG